MAQQQHKLRRRRRVKLALEVLQEQPALQINASILTPQLIDEVTDLIEDGIPLRDSCFLLSFSESSASLWIRKGMQFVDDIEANTQPDPNDQLCAVFYRRVKKAEASFRKRVITRSLTPDFFCESWIRDVTILERRDRENWGKQNDPIARPEEFNPDESFL